MKQRIRVVGLIKTSDGVLILKRNRGRSEAPFFWQLPTGKIKFGEQPEEACVRMLAEYTKLDTKSIKIRDVITFLAPEGASRLSNLYIIYDIITDSAKPVPSGKYTAYKFVKDFAASGVHLDEASTSVLEIVEGKIAPSRMASRNTASAVEVYVDGASRGNPGPSGIGHRIVGVDGRILEQGGEFIGFATSRVAEYHAMRAGLERVLSLGITSARFFSDSLMVVNQLNGVFAVKNRDILPTYSQIQELIGRFESISFTYLPRSRNRVADYEANLAIDNALKK